MQCDICQIRDAVATCVTCKTWVCTTCNLGCDECGEGLCHQHVYFTSKSKQLCPSCKNARREKKRARRKQRQKEKEVQALSFEALMDEEDVLAAEKAPGIVPNAARDDADLGEPWRKESEGAEDDDDIFYEDEEEEARRTLAVDESRPLLRVSGHQPPTKRAWIAAYVVFGLSGIILIMNVPELWQIAWPFEASGPTFNADQIAPIRDTNRLRDTRNLSNLNMFYQVPLTALVWSVFIAYLCGASLAIWGTVSNLYYKYKPRRTEIRNIIKKPSIHSKHPSEGAYGGKIYQRQSTPE